MPRYYFHLSAKGRITDPDGTVLPDKNAALSHALVVAHELMLNSTGLLGKRWSDWTLLVNDEDGRRILSLPFSEIPDGTTRH